MPQVNSLYVSKPTKGRRFAISDIHGCFLTFKSILKQIRLKKQDQLFLVGDAVNRGPSSHKVLDHIIKLKAKGFQVYFIRGNHEQAVLNSVKKSVGQRKRTLKANNSSKLLEKGEIIPKYQYLLEDSYHYIESEDYFLVHAGFNHKSGNPFKDAYSMLNTRIFKANKGYLNGKKIIIGHTPTDVSTILRRIKEGEQKLCIDNGCFHPKSKEQGSLICLNMDTGTIIIQHNLDQ